MRQAGGWNLWRIAFASVVAAVVAPGSIDHIAAQEATPTQAESSCTVPPRDTAFFETIQGTPVVPDANREPLIAAYQASAQTATIQQEAALQETLDQLVVCFNVGDFARLYALFSDSFWRREFGDSPPTRATDFASRVEATPSPVPDDYREDLRVLVDPRVLPDGRIAALVQYEQAGEIEVDLGVFVMGKDRWLIDEVVTDVDGDLATPTVDERVRY